MTPVRSLAPARSFRSLSVANSRQGGLQHLDAFRHDIDTPRDLQRFGTEDRAARWSTCLREDVRGRSLLLSRDKVSAGWLDRQESYTVDEGRIDSSSRAECPLLFGRMKIPNQEYDRILDDGLVARIVVFAEESLALAEFPTRGSPAPG